METKIATVLNEMSDVLSVSQLRTLQEVMIRNFYENVIEKSNITNEEYIKLFLEA